MKWFAAAFAWFFGMFGFFQSEPSYIMNTDTADTAVEEDTAADDTSTEDTSTEDTSTDTGDTAQDTATTDTAVKSAMELAGETGGFGCATVNSDAAISIWLGVLALGIRRREQ